MELINGYQWYTEEGTSHKKNASTVLIGTCLLVSTIKIKRNNGIVK